MKLSTTTGLYEKSGNTTDIRNINDILRILHEVGYDTFDLGFCPHEHPHFVLRGDDWEKKIDQIGETAAKLGVTFYQSHLPFVPGCCPSLYPKFKEPGFIEYFDEMTRRAYLASARLGVKWAVAHPRSYPEYNYESKASLEENRAWGDKYVELGIKLGVGTAMENMLPPLDRRQYSNRYCVHYEQLIDLVDSYNDSMVGICWDTGHANQTKCDQGRAMRAIGSRLRVLHINDNNYGFRDEHLLPFMGDVDWIAVLRALHEIHYQGTLNYETGKVAVGAYDEMQTDLAKACYQNGLRMLELYEKLGKEF